MRIMVRKILIAGLVLVCASAKAQNEGGEPVFHAASTMVTVPAVVRDSSRDFVTNLTASDFVLYDNGVQQRIKFVAIDHEPISLVVVMQTGGTASRHFSDYADLPLFLDWLIGDTKHELMLVTFDSRVEIIWHFPVRSDGVAHSLTHLHKGDGLGAMIDAVQLAVEQLQSEPGNFRRIVLLISQENDEGSTTPPEEALRMLGKGSTAVYSLTFGAEGEKKSGKAVRGARKVHESNPLVAAVNNMREHTAAELADYTGGAHLSFGTRREFDEAFKAMAGDMRDRYVLGFQPAAHSPGLHELNIEVREGLAVTGRGGYWFDPVLPAP